MLTEIEWWGGLLFIALATCYMFARKGLKGDGIVLRAFVNLSYGMTATVLALYFYPLQSEAMKYFYLGALAVAVVATIVVYIWRDSDEQADNSGEEDDSKVAIMLAFLIFASPQIASIALGVYRSIDLVGALT